MPSHRFYLNTNLSKEEPVFLEDSEHHHLSHVMKLKPQDEIELINGKGMLAIAKIKEINKKKTLLEILSIEKKEASLPRLILAIPLMRASKLEWVIEKGTELGADIFLIFKATYSEKTMLSGHQLSRLHNLSIAACKQSGQLYLPSIEVLSEFQSIFAHEALFLFGDTRNTERKQIPQSNCVGFISGPERGFSEQELKWLDQKATSIQLNKNILRAETAPIAAISILGTLRCSPNFFIH